MANKIFTDKNGVIAKEGAIVEGLYSFGDDTGVIIKDVDGCLAVKDADGDILEIESALRTATIRKTN